VQLRDVLHVPTATNNLISISRLDEQGGRAHFDNGQVTLLDQNRQIIATGCRINRLYILNAKTI
ncbi:hypothetical protein BDR06DRAFT_857450, partial [Suillus hirtellus]